MLYLLLTIVIQIIAESLPISSSTHVRIVRALWGHGRTVIDGYIDDIAHIATLVVLAIFFWSRWFVFLRHPLRLRRMLAPIVVRTGVAVTATLILYFLFDELQLADLFPLSVGLVITTCLLYSLGYVLSRPYVPYTWHRALLLGFVQGTALLPGISRLAATYTIARWLRLSSRHAFEASFAMQVPLMIAAAGRGLFFLAGTDSARQLVTLESLITVLFSTIIAYAALFLVFSMGKADCLWWFWIYMLVPITFGYMVGVV